MSIPASYYVHHVSQALSHPQARDAIRATVVARYRAGRSRRRIAAEVGIGDTTVRTLLVEAGEPLRPASAPRPALKRCLDTPVRRAALARLLRRRYEAGDSIRTIAEIIDTSYTTTRFLLIEAGTTLRPGSNLPRPAR
jgi:transposase